ncbi:bifunctional pyrimidine biosynthesis protein, partial [Atractiella rhizophila]
DQKALWENLKHIDVLSIGTTPFQLASELNKTVSPTSGFLESTQLLLTAINDGRLTVEGLIAKMVDNPTRIFSLPEQPDTSVEVELNRQHKFESIGSWSPLDGKAAYGSIHRVVLRGQTALLDGQLLLETPIGQNVNDGFVVSRTADKKKASRFSVSGGQRPILSPPRPKAEARSPQPRSAVLNDVPSDSMLKPSVLSLMSATDILKTPSRSIAQHPAFHGRSILTVKQFNRNDLHALFGLAQELRVMIERGEAVDLLKGKVLCTLFFEASTRTSASFDAAMKRLGGSVVAVTPDKSSVTKGESLPDTIRTLGCYADGVVIRHPAVGSVQTAAKFSPVPIINAGDGIGEHPTQALLDVFTIREELGTVNGLTITIVGDLKNGRTVHSLVRILSLYQVSFIFVSPPSLSLPESVKSEPRKQGLSMHETTNLESVIGQTDVLYVTRVQQERFASEAEYDAVKDAYIVNNELLSNAKSHMIVMHPLPRNAEIDPE